MHTSIVFSLLQDAISLLLPDEKDPLNIQQDVDRIFGSQHGYDTRHMAMKSYFMAKGPFFKEGYRASPISSVILMFL